MNCASHHCSVSSKVLRVRQCFAKKQKSVFHMTAVLHMTVSGHQLWVSFRLVCIWFQIRHAKTKLWFLHAKIKKNKVAHPPFKLNWRRPETCKNQFHLPHNFPMETHAHAGQKKLSIWSFMLCADSTPSGILPTCTYCGQNGLGKFSVVNTCLVPIHVIHPSMLVALAPTKFLREQVAETG